MKKSEALSKKRILELFDLLNERCLQQNIRGELYLVGGAVLCLVFDARKSTMDIDGLFLPSTQIRELSKKIAEEEDLPLGWLNDGVKGFMSEAGDYSVFLDLSHLKIFTASPAYLLAMKCLSMRIGEEFADMEDVRYLLRYLNIETVDQAIESIVKYYPKDSFPPKTIYVLEEFLKQRF